MDLKQLFTANKLIEKLIITTLFLGNIVISMHTLGEIKNYVLIGGFSVLIPLFLYTNWKYMQSNHTLIIDKSVIIVAMYVSFVTFRMYLSDDSTGHLLILLLAFSLFCYAKSLSYYCRMKLLKQVVFIIFLTGILQSLMGLAQYLFDDDTQNLYKTLVTGTLMSPNLFGGYICLSLAACGVLLYNNHRYKYLYYVSLAILTLALLLSYSRGAILSLLLSSVSIFTYYLYKIHYKTNKKKKYLLCGFVIGTTALAIAFISINKPSSEARVMKGLIGSTIIQDYPFLGTGYAQYQTKYFDYQTTFFKNTNNHRFIPRANEDETTNNQFLKIVIEFGIIGLLLFCYLIVFILNTIFSVKYLSRLTPYRCFISFSLLCMIFHMLFDETLRFPIIIIIFFLICGFLPSKNVKARIHFSITIIWKFMLTSILLTLLILSISYIKQYPAVKFYNQAKSLLAKGDLANAIFFAQRAIDISPNYTSAKIILGRSLIGYNTVGESEAYAGIEILEEVSRLNKSRDIFLALSLGHMKCNDMVKSYKYARIVDDFLPNQIRASVMLYLLQNEIPLSEIKQDIYKLSENHPDRYRMLSLLEMTKYNNLQNHSSTNTLSADAIKLLDLIMIAH